MKEQSYVTRGANRNYDALNPEDNHNIVPIGKAIFFLSVHIKEIRNVSEWANKMGYSRSHFSREIKEYFHASPKRLLRNAKLLAVVVVFLKNPYRKALVIATQTGFEHEKSLGQFLSRNFGITIKEVRRLSKLYSKQGTGTAKASLNITLLKYLKGLTQNKKSVYLLKKHKLRSEKSCKKET